MTTPLSGTADQRTISTSWRWRTGTPTAVMRVELVAATATVQIIDVVWNCERVRWYQ